MSEGSLSRAATRLGMSQPAVSHALARLRVLTNDELFVRTGHGVRPTERAIELASPLRNALEFVQLAFDERQWRHKLPDSDRTFVLDLAAGFDIVIIPSLLKYARAIGVTARFMVHSDRSGDLTSGLRSGEVDLVLGLAPTKARGMASEVLYNDDFVVCVRQDHPQIASHISPEDYISAGHVTLKWTNSAHGSPVDDRLSELGINRAVEVAMPTIAGCASVAANSNLLFTIHRRLGRQLVTRFGLKILPVPF
ncbi:MAG: LysR family transcriptional regulator, partial [Proteobacteria bacterium]|nr:LysR family transcriptional regulator [Pseudomonadota bacterium]